MNELETNNIKKYSDYRLYKELRNIFVSELLGHKINNLKKKSLEKEALKRNELIISVASEDAASIAYKSDFSFFPINNLFQNLDSIQNYIKYGSVERENKKSIDVLELYNAEWIIVEVKGNSMVDALINDGDVVLVRKTKNAIDEDIILVEVNGQKYIKRYKTANGRIFLKSENEEIADRIIQSNDEFKIIGIVEKIIKDL